MKKKKRITDNKNIGKKNNTIYFNNPFHSHREEPQDERSKRERCRC